MSALRSYPIPLKGQPLLVCGKCQKKVKRSVDPKVVRSLKKALKACAERDASPVRLRVLQVGCLKMCPKDAVTVATRAQMGRGECSVVKTAEDVAALYESCR